MIPANVGENLKPVINLFQQDGTTPLLLANIAELYVTVMQGRVEYATYKYLTDAELTAYSTSAIQVECKKSLGLKAGKIRLKVSVAVTDMSFPVEQKQYDVTYVEDVAEFVE